MESKKILKRIWNDKILVLCLFFLLIMGLMALMAPVLAPNNPDKLNLTEKFMAPCVKYPLGTDNMGRCMLSRILYGARPTMGYAVLVTLIASVIGTLAGMASGFLGGKLDYIIMRLCDILRAFPGIVVVMIMVSLFGVGIHNVCLSMLFTRWIWYARVSRNMTKAEKERTSVMASILAGSNSFQILLHNILPAILPQMLSVMTINFGSALLSISSYSFLGLGVQPPTAEWGMMISDGKSYISTHSSMMFWPGLCILLVVLAANISGDRLRDILEENRT